MRTRADFEIVTTADGSPSLMIADSTGYAEKMHHARGAFTETIYIYDSVIKDVLRRGWPLRVLSLGLGLGYNELLAAAEATLNGIAPSSARIFSFEVEPLLSHSFLSWIQGSSLDFADLYSDVLQRVVKELSVTGPDVVAWLKKSYEIGTWQLRGAFPSDAHAVTEVSCLLYDSFSRKMSPELWTEEVLKDTFAQLCAENCMFTTYAATGSLKRALKASGFRLIKRPGFAGRRESTLAVREFDSTMSATVIADIIKR